MAEGIENVDEAERIEPPVASTRAGSTLPFTLTLVALLIYFGFQTLQLFVERSNLAMVKSNQEGAIQEAQKLQAQFKTLVGKTGELAAQGHAGAKMVMEELLQRGAGPAPAPTPPSHTETKPAQ